jgi:hypothetical protein
MSGTEVLSEKCISVAVHAMDSEICIELTLVWAKGEAALNVRD